MQLISRPSRIPRGDCSQGDLRPPHTNDALSVSSLHARESTSEPARRALGRLLLQVCRRVQFRSLCNQALGHPTQQQIIERIARRNYKSLTAVERIARGNRQSLSD